jgi:hypothetical protein
MHGRPAGDMLLDSVEWLLAVTHCCFMSTSWRQPHGCCDATCLSLLVLLCTGSWLRTIGMTFGTRCSSIVMSNSHRHWACLLQGAAATTGYPGAGRRRRRQLRWQTTAPSAVTAAVPISRMSAPASPVAHMNSSLLVLCRVAVVLSRPRERHASLQQAVHKLLMTASRMLHVSRCGTETRVDTDEHPCM